MTLQIKHPPYHAEVRREFLCFGICAGACRNSVGIYLMERALRDETKMFSSKHADAVEENRGNSLDAETDIGFNDIQKTREFQCRNPFFI